MREPGRRPCEPPDGATRTTSASIRMANVTECRQARSYPGDEMTMTSERTQAYGRVLRTLEDVGPHQAARVRAGAHPRRGRHADLRRVARRRPRGARRRRRARRAPRRDGALDRGPRGRAGAGRPRLRPARAGRLARAGGSPPRRPGRRARACFRRARVDAASMAARRILLLGAGDLTDETGEALEAAGADVAAARGAPRPTSCATRWSAAPTPSPSSRATTPGRCAPRCSSATSTRRSRSSPRSSTRRPAASSSRRSRTSRSRRSPTSSRRRSPGRASTTTSRRVLDGDRPHGAALRDGEVEEVAAAGGPRAARSRARHRDPQAVRPQRRARLLRRRRAAADPDRRDGRGGDRARPEPDRRVLRRGQDARHRRPEPRGPGRPEVVQADDLALDAGRAAVRRRVHRRPGRAADRAQPHRPARPPRGAALRPRRRRRARPGRPAPVHAAARVRDLGRRDRRPARRRERRPRAPARAAGGDRPRRRPVAAAPPVARPRASRWPRSPPTTCRTSGSR